MTACGCLLGRVRVAQAGPGVGTALVQAVWVQLAQNNNRGGGPAPKAAELKMGDSTTASDSNVRVAVRCRPLSSKENKAKEKSIFDVRGGSGGPCGSM